MIWRLKEVVCEFIDYLLCARSAPFSNAMTSSKISGSHFHHHHFEKISVIIHHVGEVGGEAIR